MSAGSTQGPWVCYICHSPPEGKKDQKCSRTWESLNIHQGRKLFMLALHILFEQSLIVFEHNLVSSVVFSF